MTKVFLVTSSILKSTTSALAIAATVALTIPGTAQAGPGVEVRANWGAGVVAAAGECLKRKPCRDVATRSAKDMAENAVRKVEWVIGVVIDATAAAEGAVVEASRQYGRARKLRRLDAVNAAHRQAVTGTVTHTAN